MTTIYQFTVPVFVRILTALDAIVAKAEAWAKEAGHDEKELLDTRLAPDMFPLVKQIQLASDHAKGGTARLSGQEPPSYPDTETTFTELRVRIAKTIEYVQSVPESAFEKAHEQKVTLPYFPGKYINGLDYARGFVMGNFFFHVTTAYDILRMKGLDIGKMDFFGGAPELSDLPNEGL